MGKKMSSNIGKALTSAFVLYKCTNGGITGYRIMQSAKNILLYSWSPGSFYPLVSNLIAQGYLQKKKIAGKRVSYEFSTTPKGKEYLKSIQGYFKNPEVREFFAFLMQG